MRCTRSSHRPPLSPKVLLTLLVALAVLSGCSFGPSTPAVIPARLPPPSAPAPPPAYRVETGAAAGLYLEAEGLLARGAYERAAMAMERALRIEPHNGHYWHALAQINYRQGNYPQAINFCLKSNSLAGVDELLVQRNDALIEQARQQIR